jgi:endonuclease/exonuclease/phosphatase family metal-dependent hydrolase
VRCEQARAVAEFVAAHSGSTYGATGEGAGHGSGRGRRSGRGPAHPPVLTGDFNAVPDSDEMRLLGGMRTAPAEPGQVLLDAWEYAGRA